MLSIATETIEVKIKTKSLTKRSDTFSATDGYKWQIEGLKGHDTIWGANSHDTVKGGLGDDVIYGGDGKDVLHGGSGADAIYGDAGNNRLFGEDGDDTLFGGSGKDTLNGGAGDDVIYAGTKGSVIEGGFGVDTMVGGKGVDVFRFAPGETGASLYYSDTVMSFKGGKDKIDLSQFDADAATEGRQPLTYVISKVMPPWEYEPFAPSATGQVTIDSLVTGTFRVSIDVDGDGTVDAAIQVRGTITSLDLIL